MGHLGNVEPNSLGFLNEVGHKMALWGTVLVAKTKSHMIDVIGSCVLPDLGIHGLTLLV